MAKAGFLSKLVLLQRCAGSVAATLLSLVCLWLAAPAQLLGDAGLATLDALPVADQYRQLNLALMVAEGANQAFVAQLLPAQDDAAAGQAQNLPILEVEDFQTPLNRIVDQQALIAEAVRTFAFVLARRDDMVKKLAQLAADEPAQVAAVDLIELAEDAIIVRSALSGSIEYMARDDPALAPNLESYQNGTLYLRNVMEYWKFDRELAAITDDAMQDTGGRMEAYQRMLEEEPNMLGFKQHLQAIEEIYRNTRGRTVKPKELENKKLIDEESQVH
jgi:hypothetical protein